MHPKLTLAYVEDLGRILSSDGIAVFQIPRTSPRAVKATRIGARVLRGVKAVLNRRPRMQMYAVPPLDVHAALSRGGLNVVREYDDPDACDWPSYLYVAARAIPD
jgi:hypothetical protein